MTANVAIDNDFLSHLVEITGHEDLHILIVDFFKGMKVYPEMHPLVYDNETKPNQKAVSKQLFDEEVIKISDFSSVIDSPAKKQYYEIMVKEIYRRFMGKEFPCKDICCDWKKQCSLGEVHTVVFSVIVGIDCFLSDDKDVANYLGGIVKSVMFKTIEVKNRKDCCDYIKTLPSDSHNLNSKRLKIIAHKRTK